MFLRKHVFQAFFSMVMSYGYTHAHAHAHVLRDIRDKRMNASLYASMRNIIQIIFHMRPFLWFNSAASVLQNAQCMLCIWCVYGADREYIGLMFNDNSFSHFIKTMKHFTEHENSCPIFVRLVIIFILSISLSASLSASVDPKFMISATWHHFQSSEMDLALLYRD